MNEETPKDAQLSGYSYVPAMMKVDHPGTKPDRIQVRTSRLCNHVAFVCSECLSVWEYDWTFFFDRTAGGRRLKAQAGRSDS